MNQKKYYLSLMLLCFTACMASSRPYKPLDWEKPYFENAEKYILPLDIRNNPDKYLNRDIHWVGIIDTFWVDTQNDTAIVSIVLDQKYYDYIEDFSIQDEKIFLSPRGEGKFIHIKRITNISADTIRSDLSKLAEKGNLGFCYGAFTGLDVRMPVLEGGPIRFIHEKDFATNICSYEVERDADGKVIVDDRGFPKLKNFKMLKVPGPGKND